MNKVEAYKTRLEEMELETLKFFVNIVKQQNSQSIEWRHDSGEYEAGNFTILGSDIRKKIPQAQSLSKLGFFNISSTPTIGVENTPNLWHITVMPSALYRVEYENKNRVTKKLLEWKEGYKDLMAVFGFFLSSILTLIKIYEVFVGPIVK